MQPPSGGCVLKHRGLLSVALLLGAATFGWLCVETVGLNGVFKFVAAATFGWLCVETAPF